MSDPPASDGVRRGLAAYTIWGLLTVYWKQLSGFRAIELIGWRMACAGVVMVVIVTARHSWPTLLRALRDPAMLVRLALTSLLLAANWGSYVWAVVNDRVIETALGYFIAPLALMAIGVLAFKETPTNAQRAAFALALIAVVVLTVASGRPPWIALIIAGTWSLYGTAKRQIALDAVDSLAGETFVFILPAVIVLFVVSGRADSAVSSASVREWLFIAGTGLITAIPLMLFASAAKSIPFTLLGPLNLLVPVINFALGWLLYGEPMPIERIVGFSFVWAALVIVMGDRIRAARGAPRPALADVSVQR